MKEKIKKTFEIERLLQRFIAAWCCINLYTALSIPIPFTDISFTFSIELVVWLVLFAAVFAFFTLLSLVLDKIHADSWLFTLCFAAFAGYTLTVESSFWYTLAIFILAAIAIAFLLKDDKLALSKTRIGNKTTAIIAAVFGIMMLVFIAAYGCLRYATYSSPNFDFGIWCNMFHYMKETGLPTVSCERDRILSHFAVHISPIYYLLLPLYMVFPSPHTLQIGQALAIASGLIPLYLLCRYKGLSNKFIIALSIAYSFSPVLISGIGYDMHENSFLVPTLLWMFYFFERQKYPLMYIAALFVCAVKEDAALFVLFFGIYLFLSKKKYLHGVILAVGSVAIFGLGIYLINTFGDGVLASRFDNYMYMDEGLLGMAKIIITNPAYVFTQVLSADKLIYILRLLLPLGLLPIVTRKVSHFILVLPIMLINIMTNYPYQHNIDFQYSFGGAAILCYLAVINAAEIKGYTRRYLITLAAAASVIMFLPTAGEKINIYAQRYINDREEFVTLTQALETIPKEASVRASTFFVPHIADRNEIYEIVSNNETDYMVFDMRPSLAHETDDLRGEYLAKGYTIELDIPDRIMIMKAPENVQETPALILQGETQ
ncbi:MAG: DUF2079 domain-containing protein [Clostridia bacterium]|nr:DUF2079 domain-containing protein [Clostridia bacterium]